MVALGTLACATGCGDDAAPAPPWTSGARLRAEVVDGGDGAVLFRGWHDRDLDTACAFATAADGALRCLPTETAFLIYADAACSQRAAVYFRSADCAPAFAAEPAGLGCPDEPRALYPVGDALGEGPVYVERDGACERFTDAPRFAVGPAVDPTRFVAATVRTDDHGDGLAARVAFADDGARQILSLADRDGVPCSRLELADGASACVGAAAYVASFIHADDACTSPPVAITARCPGVPDVVIDDGDVYLAGSPLAEPLYDTSTSSCVLTDRYVGWRPGRLATAADFPAAPTTTTGAGALQLRWASDAAGTPLVAEALVDAARATGCTAMRTEGDGDAGRCLPATALWSSGVVDFADAACTVPVWSLFADRGPRARVVITGAPSCGEPSVAHVYDVAPYAGPRYRRSDAGCAVSTEPIGDYVYAATAELPLTDFPAVTFRRE